MLTVIAVFIVGLAAVAGVGVLSYLRGRRHGIRIGLAVDHCRRIDAAAAASSSSPWSSPNRPEPLTYDWSGLPIYDAEQLPLFPAGAWLRGVQGITDGIMPTEQPGAFESRPPTSPGDQPAGAGPDIHDNPDGGI